MIVSKRLVFVFYMSMYKKDKKPTVFLNYKPAGQGDS